MRWPLEVKDGRSCGAPIGWPIFMPNGGSKWKTDVGPQMWMSSLVLTIQVLGCLILTHTQMISKNMQNQMMEENWLMILKQLSSRFSYIFNHVEKIWEAAWSCWFLPRNSSILRGAPWRSQDLPLQLRREAAEREMLEEGLGLPPEADALARRANAGRKVTKGMERSGFDEEKMMKHGDVDSWWWMLMF